MTKVLKIGDLPPDSKVIYLGSIAEVRKFVENYTPRMMASGGNIIGNLSKLTREGSATLLKFIEEETNDITCFASDDNVNPVLMSRFDIIEKNEKINIGFDSFGSFVNSNKEKVRVLDLPKDFASKSAQNLDKFLFWRKLDGGLRHRLEDLL